MLQQAGDSPFDVPLHSISKENKPDEQSTFRGTHPRSVFVENACRLIPSGCSIFYIHVVNISYYSLTHLKVVPVARRPCVYISGQRSLHLQHCH